MSYQEAIEKAEFFAHRQTEIKELINIHMDSIESLKNQLDLYVKAEVAFRMEAANSHVRLQEPD